MKSRIQACLVMIAIVFLVWGLGFVLIPKTVHEALSYGPYDPATANLFAASMLGMSLIFLINAQDPHPDQVYGLAAALAFLAIAAALGMLPEGGLQTNAGTIASLVVTIGVALFLFIVQSNAVTAARARKEEAQREGEESEAGDAE